MEPKLLPCPECGSSDVAKHLVDTRPHCNHCGFWSPEDWGSREDALKKWNEISAARWELKEIPNRVSELEKKVEKLEKNIQKMDKLQEPE